MTDFSAELAEGEVAVTDPSELIYRQITEWMLTGGAVQTSAFGAANSDRGKPSYARSSKTTAQEARDWHNRNARKRSLAVWALSVEEVLAEQLLVVDDTASPLPPGEKRSPGHCYIDMRQLSKVEIKSIRFRLHQHAARRGEIPTSETVPEGQLIP